MRYKRMPVSGGGKVSMPRLSGGLNVYDAPNRVGDNQLTDGDNLWWHRGALRTRPGVVTDGTWDETDAYTTRQKVSEREALLLRLANIEGTNRLYASHLSIEGGHQGLREQGYALQGSDIPSSALGVRAKKNSGAEWYYLIANGEIVQEAEGEWTAAEPYVPTVLINGVGEECEADAEPSVYEDYNMLTRAFQCHFTTDGTSTTFKLPEDKLATNRHGVDGHDKEGDVWAIVEIDIPTTDGISTEKVELKVGRSDQGITIGEVEGFTSEDLGYPGPSGDMKLRITIQPKRGIITLTLYDNLGTPEEPKWNTAQGGFPFTTTNNLRVTAWRGREHEKDRLTICKMTRGEWFGGDRSGIAGGTRYFVCGNPDEPDLLCWSGIEHPLYFPEHNRVRVGDDHQAITAMGKQGSLLVLYKERETYAMQYTSGDDADHAFAESGGVAITSYMAIFLLTPINASVGCDCPDTVRLVNNRLVRRYIYTAVFLCTGKTKHVVILVDGTANRTKRVVAVGKHVRHGELLKS